MNRTTNHTTNQAAGQGVGRSVGRALGRSVSQAVSRRVSRAVKSAFGRAADRTGGRTRGGPVDPAGCRTGDRAVPRLPVVTCALMLLCTVIFLVGPASGFLPGYGTGSALHRAQAAYFDRWGVVPRALWSGAARPFLTPLTALFLHAGWLHLLGNMLFLHVFGGPVEARTGRLRFAVCYLCAGYTAMLCYAVAHHQSAETLVGASGAVSAVLGAFLYLHPTARVTSLFPFLYFVPLRFPAWLVLVFWLGLQWFAARGDGDGTGVAYLAHVVGFTLGFLYAWARFRRFRTATVGRPAPATQGESTS
jgi:membrane associated rhomboid family serine protease